MFSQTAEYALRVAVYLAALHHTPATIAQISSATQTPCGYIAKVIKNLSRAGIIVSQRGKRGGSVLARPADQISVWDVIEAVDPIRKMDQCPLRHMPHVVRLCSLHRRLQAAVNGVEEMLRAATLAELVMETEQSSPPCTTKQAKRRIARGRATNRMG